MSKQGTHVKDGSSLNPGTHTHNFPTKYLLARISQVIQEVRFSSHVKH